MRVRIYIYRYNILHSLFYAFHDPRGRPIRGHFVLGIRHRWPINYWHTDRYELQLLNDRYYVKTKINIPKIFIENSIHGSKKEIRSVPRSVVIKIIRIRSDLLLLCWSFPNIHMLMTIFDYIHVCFLKQTFPTNFIVNLQSCCFAWVQKLCTRTPTRKSPTRGKIKIYRLELRPTVK